MLDGPCAVLFHLSAVPPKKFFALSFISNILAQMSASDLQANTELMSSKCSFHHLRGPSLDTNCRDGVSKEKLIIFP